MTTFIGTSGPPTVPPFASPRSDLVDRLDEALTRPTVLLVAPTGYGKSVLLGQWAEAQPDRAVAWVGISDLDNDAVHFSRHLCDALEEVEPGLVGPLRESLHATTDSLGPMFLDRLLAVLQAADGITIVVDDLERLTSPPVLGELGLVAERLPRGAHLVLSCRIDPAMGLHRVRARDELAELREGDLAMGEADAAHLARELAGVELRTDQARTLVARTEGWPAGLQLAALSLRGREDVDSFITEFSGNDRHVADYLSGELLADLAPDERDFLVTTAVLDLLDGPACDALTGRDDGAAMLEDLHRRALFVAPVDGRRDRYRYHPLFQDLLRYELRTARPGAEAGLHARAAEWYRYRGRINEAARHLLAAEDWEGVIELAEAHAREYFERGDNNIVLGWMNRLPSEVVRSRPEVALAVATLEEMGGRALAAEEQLERVLADQRLSPALEALAHALRSLLVHYHLAPTEALAAATRADEILQDCPPAALPVLTGITDTATIQVVAQVGAARAELLEGHLGEARRWLELAARGTTFPLWAVHVQGTLAQVEVQAGRLQAADAAATRALAVAVEAGAEGHRARADVLLARGRLLVEWLRFDEAERSLAEGEVAARSNRRHVLLAMYRVEQAALLLATGRIAEGLALIQAGVEPGHPPPPPGVQDRFLALEARLLAAAGRPDRALVMLAAYGGPPTTKLARAEASVAASARDLARVRKVVGAWPTQDAGEPASRLARRLWEAVLLDGDGERRAGQEVLAEVVTEAEPDGHLLFWLDGGRYAARMLRRLYHDDPTPYLRQVVDAVAEGPAANRSTELIEQLSERELAVLRYLPSRLSNPEIAEKLFVSVNTVKTHVKAVYRKLGVTSRSEAVERAEELGLV